MNKCSGCSIPLGEDGTMSMWAYIKGYRPRKKGNGIEPIYGQSQGILCVRCFKSFSAYEIKSFTDLKPSPKKKNDIVERPQTFDW